MSQKRQRSIRATPEGIKCLLEAKGSFKESFEDDRLAYDKIAEELKIHEKTVARFFRGEGIDKENAYSIIKFLGLSAKDVISSEDFLVEDIARKLEREKVENSERAKELIEALEIALSELKQSEEISLQAMDWLKANRKALAREAAEAVLRKHFIQNSADKNADELGLERFSQDILKYLQLLYYSLEEGSWELIDKAIQESIVPANLEIEFYTEALTFIKDQKVSQNLPPEAAKSTALLLDYLIKILPIKL